jgi:excisionase family DNA binding protein
MDLVAFKAYFGRRLHELATEEVGQAAPSTKKYLDADEAGEYVQMSKSILYKKTASNEIPHIKPGNKLLFTKEELDQYLSASRVKTATAIDEDAATAAANMSIRKKRKK